MERGIKKGKAARKRLFALALTLAMVFTSVSVPSVTAEAAKNVKVKKIQITNPKKKKVTLVKGKTLQIKVKVTPKNAKNKKVSYKSSKKKIASVSKKGKVKGLKKGTAKITVTAKDGSKKKATLTVKVVNPVKVTKVTVSPAATTLDVGKTVALKAACAPKNATNKEVSWKSSDTGVATVTAQGVVKGVKAGTAKVTATAKDGSKKSAACTVTVRAASVTPPPTPPASTKTLAGIAVTKAPTKTEYYKDEKFDPAGMEVTASYSDKSTKALAANAYTLSPSVDTPLKTSNKAVTVSYTEGGVTKTATTPIKVTLAPTVKSLSIATDPTKTVYEEGEKFDPAGMVVEATYSDGSTKAVTDYTYPQEDLEVTAGAQYSKIAISYTEKSKTVTANVQVTVKAENPLKSIHVELEKTTLEREGGCFQEDDVTVTATFNDDSTKKIEVADCIVDPAVFTKEITSATVSYWYGGEKKSDTVSGFRVTAYREKYTFEDADTIGTLVKRANEDANDIPTEEHAGDITPQFVPGLQGNALKMDGTYGVRLDKIAGTGSQSYSISMWVKPEAFKTSQALVISTSSEFGFNGNPDGETWCAVADADSNGTLKLWSRDKDQVYPNSSGWVTVPGSPVVQKDKWSHIVLVVDGTTTAAGTAPEEGASFSLGTLYVNGKKVASGDVFNEKANGRGPKMKTYFGANAWSADGYYKGLVDEFVFTSEVLTESDVEAYYIENAKATGQIAEITAVSPDDGEEIEVEYGTSLKDLKDRLAEIAYTAKVEGSEKNVSLTTTSGMWTVEDYTVTSTGEVTASVKLQAPDGYLFKQGEGLSVGMARTVTVKIKEPVTVSAVTPSQTGIEVEYGTPDDAIKEKLAELTFTATTSDSSKFEIVNSKSLWTLTPEGDGYKATFELKDKPGYKYAAGVKVEVSVTVKQPITITALAADPSTVTVNYNTSEADVKDKLAELAIKATVAAGSQAPESIANTADMWEITDYAAATAGNYQAKATATAPVGYKFADSVGEVSATVTVKPQGEHKLSEIKVTTKPRVKYIVGDNFDKTGMVITAYYEDGQSEPVTAQATIGTAENLQLGTQKIDISYTKDGKTATCDLTITTVKVEDGAMAHYTFDDTLVNDECKGTAAADAPTATWVKNAKGTEAGTSDLVYGEGVKGNAVQVGANGATDIVKLDKTVKGTDFSINMWVKPLAVAGGFKPIICSTTMAANNRSLVIYAKPNSASDVRVYGSGRKQANGGGANEEDIAGVLTVGKWTMLTWVNKGTTTNLYADGEEISNSVVNITELPNIFLGGHGGAFSDPVFQGMYDEVGIYDCSLSENQVKALYGTVTPTISSISVDTKEISLTKAEAGNDATAIQNKLKALKINVAMKNGTAPVFENNTDWTLTPAYSGNAGTFTATKEVTIPDGYDKTKDVNTTLSVTVKVVDITLQSIAITTAPNKGYYKVGEEFDKTGMVVTATYSDNSTKDVTENVTITNGTAALPNGTTADTVTQEVTISYAEGESEAKTAVQNITVINAGTDQGAVLAQMTGYFKFDGSLKNEISGGSAEELALSGNVKDPVSVAYNSEGAVNGKALKVTGPMGKGVKLDAVIADTANYSISMWVKAVNLGGDGFTLTGTDGKTINGAAHAPVLYMGNEQGNNTGDKTTWFSNMGGNAEHFLIRGSDYGSRNDHESGNIEGVLVKDTWKMITLSVSNNAGTIYVDGEQKGTVNMKQTTNAYLYLATCPYDYAFNAEYDEVCIFDNVSLTEKQIKTLYDNSKPAATPSLEQPTE